MLQAIIEDKPLYPTSNSAAKLVFDMLNSALHDIAVASLFWTSAIYFASVYHRKK
jgi:hypothetical protein